MRIVVVGAGPAGMAAARTAADAGAEVTMVDSEPEAGGQYLRGRARFSHAGVTHLKNTEAWLVEGNTLHLRGPAQLRFDALVIATGAYDRPLPFPGWDGPGVITAGAAQALAKQGVTLAERVIVTGTGPFLLPVATALQDLGATLVGVYEASSPTRWLREAKAITANRHKIGELAGYRKVLPRLETRTAVIAKHGDRVTVAKLDSRWRPVSHRTVHADLVCVGYGFLPRTDLLPDARRTNDFYDVDERQRTSVENVYAAGEVTGIGGADLAEAEGVVAGAAAAGLNPPAKAVEAVRKGRLFAQALARAHAVQPGWQTWPAPDTTVCRCEKVRLEDLTGATSMRELKLTSRVAMGRCQGRICARNAAELTGVPFDGQRRVIAVPIPLGELAALPEEKKS
ncbi:Pyruvate/2-oxoglutarate dehydrogenase complex, dihydrolipoamide dehydrogenase (E3) component [Lentzea albidocapillata subsp. violacea]|uniref:Pyruvate/2-oxoglutarate dehydrogenase complex, dihydrolipoamide dehydrogenase (E3) component n=1 Tax=Lentzea albidocapillata subsp. violacea TaxID=128104 RepID=A0A1G8Z4L6_9PSEU|nr:FAD/NAD(P)-binding oxidoreductase [Lentzea albidocapillata]SDK09170.1 Pyruvate/2-oxoglutarate dehydrogenase complex, dihydrolipoamide dehydrogenase (E3) component [Lentzea albidocapillata subsp. violacea]